MGDHSTFGHTPPNKPSLFPSKTTPNQVLYQLQIWVIIRESAKTKFERILSCTVPGMKNLLGWVGQIWDTNLEKIWVGHEVNDMS